MNSITDLINNAGQAYVSGAAQQQVIIAAIIGIVEGIIVCFFGLKIFRVLCVLYGLVFGAALGIVIAYVVNPSTTTSALIIILAAAIICAVLFGVLKRVGAFFMAFCMSALAAMMIILPILLIEMAGGVSVEQLNLGVPLGIGLAVSFILALLAAIFMDPLIIIATAIHGGLMAGGMIIQLAGQLMQVNFNAAVSYIVGIVLVILGMIVQFSMHSSKIARQERSYAEQVRKENSVESEVEQARMVLDEGIEDDDDID